MAADKNMNRDSRASMDIYRVMRPASRPQSSRVETCSTAVLMRTARPFRRGRVKMNMPAWRFRQGDTQRKTLDRDDIVPP